MSQQSKVASRTKARIRRTSKPPCIGIDFGTTFSRIAWYNPDTKQPEIIPNAESEGKTPSVAYFGPDEALIGPRDVAGKGHLRQLQAVSSIKRSLVDSPFVPGLDGRDRIRPIEVVAQILSKLKSDAEEYFGEEVTEAVITVPACFEDAQRQAIKDAGHIAGLDVKWLTNEPSAVALAYGMNKEQDQTILVFDLGGGTFDVSILELGEGVFEVKATSGNNHLGGDDFDAKIVEWMVQEFREAEGIDLSKDRMAAQRLIETAEKAKRELSSTTSTSINLPFITADQNGPKHMDLMLTRAQFNNLTADLVEATVGPVQRAMEDVGLKAGDVDQVILVGGSTRIPAVQEKVKELMSKERLNVISDEAGAIGAAIWAGVRAGEVKDVLLLDVTPLSLGIETKGGVFTKLIERNTTIPTRKGEIFTTAEDNQSSVELKVYQGEREIAAHNKLIGNFQLTGIPPAPRGVPQIKVSFDIDANGIVNVGAKDLGTGKEQQVTITGSSSLSNKQIEEMMRRLVARRDSRR